MSVAWNRCDKKDCECDRWVEIIRDDGTVYTELFRGGTWWRDTDVFWRYIDEIDTSAERVDSEPKNVQVTREEFEQQEKKVDELQLRQAATFERFRKIEETLSELSDALQRNGF